MSTAILNSPVYSFDYTRNAPIKWSEVQEKSISTNYPLEHLEHLAAFVGRIYLQFLWLPESLLPLPNLVPTLQRISLPGPSSTSSTPHPLHAFLDPLLNTTSLVSTKYHTELSQILEHGGGAGEMEETMMWYVVEHDKATEASGGAGGENGIWTDEKWRKGYLERMEKREVQIQILLYLLKLSLPGPVPPPSPTKSTRPKPKPKLKRVKGRRGRGRSQPIESDPTPEEYLESFMDKLAVWQLMDDPKDNAVVGQPSGQNANPKGKGKAKVLDERDWTQVFVEDVVEPQFKHLLPNLITLLRSKVFPNTLQPTSDISDGDTDVEDMNVDAPVSGAGLGYQDTTVLVPTGVPLKRALSRMPSTSTSIIDDASSLRSGVGRVRALSRAPSHGPKRALSRVPSQGPAAASTSTALSRVRSLSRAPSMSRTTTNTTNLPSPTHSTISTTSHTRPRATSTVNRTLLRSRSQSQSQSQSHSQSLSLSETLAQEQKEKFDRLVSGGSDMAGTGGTKRKPINREVSMSKSFKRVKSKSVAVEVVVTALKETEKADEEREKEREREKKEREMGVTLVEETPVKQRVLKTLPFTFGVNQAKIPSLNFGVTGIKVDGGRLSIARSGPGLSSLPASSSPVSVPETPPLRSGEDANDEDEDEEWMMDSSPDIRMFNPSSGSSEGVGGVGVGQISLSEEEEDGDDREEWDKVKPVSGKKEDVVEDAPGEECEVNEVEADTTPCKPQTKAKGRAKPKANAKPKAKRPLRRGN
ncbi:hypothetical protein CPB83DRAFT_910555 [Crepidotus variabilis]|uniref:DNA replication regulator Sld3 C-terminal domain-containing protein n=1 Tax=Crepidotus variabilis TaxID=179855 RepID=A0A9P6E6Y8_9AGAR|nr:hypothetical protein CPB83DRAFT_910555 [Crepidotus variabilis]